MTFARLESLDWSSVPYRWQRPLERYLADGVVPVSAFLVSVLVGNLRGALRHTAERTALLHMAPFLQEIPPECWGTPEKVSTWHQIGGMSGIHRTLEKAGGVYGR
jgi:hypothetical protein